jgi:osmotically-inducible protein OsmY
VNAKVTGGFVTLTGTASWQYQRDEARLIVANAPGVSAIEDRIKLITSPDGGRRCRCLRRTGC